MCGISGFISIQFSKEHLIKMTESIKHRGTDAEGHHKENNTSSENISQYSRERQTKVLDQVLNNILK